MDERINRALVLGSQLFAVMAVLIGAAFQERQLQSARPPGTATQVSSEENDDRYARLWEDPLRNLESFVPKQEEGRAIPEKATSSSNGDPSRQTVNPVIQENFNKGQLVTQSTTVIPTIHQFELLFPGLANRMATQGGQGKKEVAPQTKKNDLILWQVLDGRPTPEARERRVRTRYATSTTLAAMGYQPLLDTQLDVLKFLLRLDDRNKYLSVGYLEVFQKVKTDKARGDSGPTYDRVFVAWHPATPRSLGSAWRFPLTTPERVRTALNFSHDLQYRPDRNADLVVLHHGSSDQLINFIKGLPPQSQSKKTENSTDRDSPEKGKNKVYFVRATLDPTLVGRTITADTPGQPEAFAETARNHVAMTSDTQTIRALAEELRQRLHQNTEKGQRLVLFTESDSAYGRNMRNVVKAELADLFPPGKIEVYSYLRGLDGLQDSLAQEDSSAGNASGDPTRGSIERPWGTNQYDYLRRLARGLSEGPVDQGPVVAVGVLGSDPFDKLLVLQALQSEIPDAIGFTTDIDSFFFHQDYLPYTRNLLIGAGDALTCHEKAPEGGEAWRIPPMRDTYQSALVRIVREVIKKDPVAQIDPPKPRVWEVGMGRLVEMPSARPPDGKTPRAAASEGVAASVLPFFGGLALALALLAAILSREQVDESGTTRITRRACTFIKTTAGFGGIATLLLCTMLLDALLPDSQLFLKACLVGAWICLLLSLKTFFPSPDTGQASPGSPAGVLFWIVIGSAGLFYSKWLSASVIPPLLLIGGTFLYVILVHRTKSIAPAPCSRSIFATFSLTLLLAAWSLVDLNTPDPGWFERVEGSQAPGFFLGEPLDPVAGISIWPAVILRCLAFTIGVLLLLFTSKTFFEEGRHGVAQLTRLGIGSSQSVSSDPTSRLLDSTESFAAGCKPFVSPILTFFFGGPKDESLSGKNPKAIAQRCHLHDFLDHFLNPYRKLIRVALAAILYFAFSVVLFKIWPPNVPVRGVGAWWFERISLGCGVGLYIVHLVFCIELHFCAIATLRWFQRALNQKAVNPDGPALFKTIEITGRLTRVVGLTLLYPLSILSLLLLSRLRIFDDWTMTPSLFLTLLGGAGLLIFVALTLVTHSWRLRQDILERLASQSEFSHDFIKPAAHDQPESEREAETEELRQKIKAFEIGAFARWYRQPIFTALLGALLVLGGVEAADSLVPLWIK